ncbi:hypothetical protein AMK68_05180 [candidate division KD3-62 bacterium DG_56]|uniref:Uncharacterized protein n=1 Tax=candidate division KD3-62 bacterium DG_56 TaxID=1704032 RepID=A0A0S7XJJ0_9BACT|nr:MAG: hypothetical protein AMK68_05180 [candidate division KD3-62 bacterium DG_56]
MPSSDARAVSVGSGCPASSAASTSIVASPTGRSNSPSKWACIESAPTTGRGRRPRAWRSPGSAGTARPPQFTNRPSGSDSPVTSASNRRRPTSTTALPCRLPSPTPAAKSSMTPRSPDQLPLTATSWSCSPSTVNCGARSCAWICGRRSVPPTVPVP